MLTPVTMRIYIAATSGSRDRIVSVRDRLCALGIEVVGTWVNQSKVDPVPKASVGGRHAHRDLRQIAEADVLVLDALDRSISGGRCFEHGYATGLGKSIALVGPPANVFEFTIPVKFADWDSACAWLVRQAKKWRAA